MSGRKSTFIIRRNEAKPWNFSGKLPLFQIFWKNITVKFEFLQETTKSACYLTHKKLWEFKLRLSDKKMNNLLFINVPVLLQWYSWKSSSYPSWDPFSFFHRSIDQHYPVQPQSFHFSAISSWFSLIKIFKCFPVSFFCFLKCLGDQKIISRE